MEEIWKDVVGFEDYYQVSNLGRVKRIKGGRGTHIGKILHGAPATDGYWRVLLRKNSKSKCVNVHILVAKAFIPNPDNKPEVNHIDGNKLNNACSNLEWVSHKENMDHAWKNGLCHFHSEETRRKLSIAANNRSEEHRRKLSIAASNRTAEHRRKLGEAHKGKAPSEETRKKISESTKGRVYVNDGVRTKRVRPEKLQDYLNEGYVLGRIKKEI